MKTIVVKIVYNGRFFFNKTASALQLAKKTQHIINCTNPCSFFKLGRRKCQRGKDKRARAESLLLKCFAKGGIFRKSKRTSPMPATEQFFHRRDAFLRTCSHSRNKIRTFSPKNSKNRNTKLFFVPLFISHPYVLKCYCRKISGNPPFFDTEIRHISTEVIDKLHKQ